MQWRILNDVSLAIECQWCFEYKSVWMLYKLPVYLCNVCFHSIGCFLILDWTVHKYHCYRYSGIYYRESSVSECTDWYNAQFHCAGTGDYLVWEVDELVPDHPDILARGITSVTLPSSGTVQSNLTVPATSVNNGTTVQCAIGVQFNSNQ